jgi:hypothetical protein
MKNLKSILYILLFFFHLNLYSNNDSLKVKEIEYKILSLKNEVKSIKNSQINYTLEKNLLKETYSNNYERINTIITFVLGIIGFLGFFGIRDINSIKKEYLIELDNLKGLQSEFKSKSQIFENEKTKFEKEIKSILIENKKQNNKIKLLELKEKIELFIKENKLFKALDFINSALEINPEDNLVNVSKARVLCRLNRIEESLIIYRKLNKKHPNDHRITCDLIEILIFSNNIEESEKLIDLHRNKLVELSGGKLPELFELLISYKKNDLEEVLSNIKKLIDFNNLKSSFKRLPNWDFEETIFVLGREKETEIRNYLINFVLYFRGSMSGEDLCKNLKISPKKE